MMLKKLGFMNINRHDILTRNEMRGIYAGSDSGDCQSGAMSCPEFAGKTGCYPSSNPGDRCTGTDGCTYNTMKSGGSCG